MNKFIYKNIINNINLINEAFAFSTVFPVKSLIKTKGNILVYFPFIGVLLGILISTTVITSRLLFGPYSELPGILANIVILSTTRGMHIDGFCDTLDGLGCYGTPNRALAVMRSGVIGPFSASAAISLIICQIFTFNHLCGVAIVTSISTGRVAATAICRNSFSVEKGSFLENMARTQPIENLIAWIIFVITLSTWTSSNLWQGPLIIVFSIMCSRIIFTHCIKRFKIVTGDNIGAVIEFVTTITLICLSAI